MKIVEVYEKLIASRRPIDFFGTVSDADALNRLYKKFSFIVHPDLAPAWEKYYAEESMVILNRLYDEGVQELADGTYELPSSSDKFKKRNSFFEVEFNGKNYSFYELISSGDIANVFKGTCDGHTVVIKIPREASDSILIDNEFDILTKLRHQSLPYVESKISIDGARRAIISREVEGITPALLLKQYPNGVPAEHVMWMVERLLSVVGFLHNNCVVHGNITPDNILINKKNHNVTLFGFSFAIKKANESGATYKFFNDDYSAPEVLKKVSVEPSTDIYSIGKIAIKLMGGNVSNGGMSMDIDPRVRDFIRGMIKENPMTRSNDAWMLYHKLQGLRNEVYGTERFKELK
ncbi:MAG: protein kinase family protein [Clostridia bacterium]|nr:protein kinase family protein [Clostridia bacterium]